MSNRNKIAIVIFTLLFTCAHLTSAATTITGSSQAPATLMQWHKVTLNIDGPSASESGTPNPFMDYRMNVTFEHPATGTSYIVPGYFAADGNAANTSASSGNKWRAHLSPDHDGTWNYTVSFRQGTNVAVNDSPTAGTAVGAYDNISGSFTVIPTDKTGRDLRAKGRLTYVGGHFLQFAGNGEYFVKQGADAPENFLAYEDFDGPFKNDGKGDNYVKNWNPHVGDWNAGDPYWQTNKGTEIIGAINYLASEGLNAFSFLTMNINGDDKNSFPYTNYYERYRMDCSKLDQWEIVFEHADTKGMFLHFKTQETENELLLDSGNLGNQRKLYYRELIARFAHHLALNWNLGEEVNNSTTAQKKSWAQYFYDNDPYHHHIVIHNMSDMHYDLIGTGSKLTGFSFQGHQENFSDIFAKVKDYIDRSVAANKPWAVACDEPGDAQHALRPDYDAGSSHENGRKHALWGTFMAGGFGNEWYFGYGHDHSDLTCQDFRSRNAWWDYCRYALQFFSASNDIDRKPVPVQNMSNANSRVGGTGNRCLYGVDDESIPCLVVQTDNGGGFTLNVPAAPLYNVGWMNAKTGLWQLRSDITNHPGGNISFTAPGTDDWVLLLYDWHAVEDNDPPTPNPPQWQVQPYAVDDNTISMTAAEGTDLISPPVQYYFAETSGNCNSTDSGWQTGRTYTLSNLAPSTQYCFTVTMKDNRGNETDVSSQVCVMTTGTIDNDPPSPNPTGFETYPKALSSSVITMTAEEASDLHGPVEYKFTETTGNPGGSDSPWQTSRTFTDAGLEEASSYTYTVQTRDAVCNEGLPSDPITVCTQPDVDIVEDDVIDNLDLIALASQWLNENCCLSNLCEGTDLDASGTVGLNDLAILSEHWQTEQGPVLITLNHSPVHDAYKQGTSYNNTDQLRIEPNYRISYIKYDIDDIPDGYIVTNATIRLTENGDPGSGTLRFYRGDNNSWTETGLTSANEPQTQDQVGINAGGVSSGQTINVDVTPLITGNGLHTLVIKMDGGGNDIWFGSSEASGKVPLLTITALRIGGSQGQEPYNGTAFQIPADRIQAEEFDLGGEGVAYHDSSPGNTGAQFRLGESVDIQQTLDDDGGYNIGWVTVGEWLEYTIDVTPGTYNINLRLAAIDTSPGSIHLNLDGAALGTVDVSSTGAWQAYQTFTLANITLPEGDGQVLRLELDGVFNINWIEVVQDNSLHLRFDESSGSTANDSAGNNYHGTCINMDDSDWVAGKISNALDFDGVDDYVQITGYKGITGTASRTTAAWIKTSNTTWWNDIIGWGDMQIGQRWLMSISPEGFVQLSALGGYQRGTTVVNDGQWHHVAMVLDSDGTPDTSEVKIYIDGVEELAYTTAIIALDTQPAPDVQIGIYNYNDTYARYFTGMIDDVRVYEKALNPAQIFKILNAAAWLSFDEVGGSTAKDNTPNNNNGTCTKMDDSDWVPGLINNALNFDGVDD